MPDDLNIGERYTVLVDTEGEDGWDVLLLGRPWLRVSKESFAGQLVNFILLSRADDGQSNSRS